MSQTELLLWFYEKYTKDQKTYFSVRDVSRALKLEYSSANKQITKLWFFDFLDRKKQQSRRRGNKYLCYLNVYKLNKDKALRCELLLRGWLKPQSSQIPEKDNTYLSSNNIGREKTGPIGGYFDGRE